MSKKKKKPKISLQDGAEVLAFFSSAILYRLILLLLLFLTGGEFQRYLWNKTDIFFVARLICLFEMNQ